MKAERGETGDESPSAAREQVPCPRCKNPIPKPRLVDSFAFPGDIEATMDLLEGRLNTVRCALCQGKASFFVPVMVANHNANAVLIVLPDEAREDRAKIDALAKEKRVLLKVCRDYNELRKEAIRWIDGLVVPIGSKLLSDGLGRLPVEERVRLVTPFFLRVLKASLDGNLPTVWRFSGGSPEEARQLEETLYCRAVVDQLNRLCQLAFEQGRLGDLPDMIDQHVPTMCLTKGVLEDLAASCDLPVTPSEDPQAFLRGYLSAYLSAAAHACADVPNPRGRQFAAYLSTCWQLNRREDVVFDKRAVLPNAAVHRVLRFENLWDELTARAPGGRVTSEYLEDVFALLADLGYSEHVVPLTKAGFLRFEGLDRHSAEDPERSADLMLDGILKRSPFNRSAEDSEVLGGGVVGLVAQLLRNGLEPQALALLSRARQAGTKAGDAVAVVSMCVDGMEVLCCNLLYREASELADAVLDLLDDERVRRRPFLVIRAWNEVGNVGRYLHHRSEALEAYRVSGELNETAPIEEELRESNRLVLQRNIAILRRESGDFRSALEALTSVAEKQPKDAEVLHNLALLYVEVNHHEDALRCLDRAIAMSSGALRAVKRSHYLFSRSQVHLAAGREDEGLRDLQEAFEHAPAHHRAFRAVLAAAALSYHPDSHDGQRFVAECLALVQRLLAAKDYVDSALESTFLAVSLCMRFLRDGQVGEAQRIFTPLWEQAGAERRNYDWRFTYVHGWLQYEQHRDVRCWPILREVMERVDAAVPTGSNVQFAPSWLQDKDRVQDLLATAALDLVGRGLLGGEELLAVYEFMNGREIGARLLGEEAASKNVGSAILARCASHPTAQERNLKVFFIIETERRTHVARLDARDRTVTLLDLPGIELAELGALRSQLRQALQGANPADVARLDEKLAGWEALSRRLGAAIAPHLQPGAHVWFLPGRAFTGLPLHLLTMPDDRRLVEWNPVAFAPNFAVLLNGSAPERREAGESVAIVAVTKAADSPMFERNVMGAGDALATMLGPRKVVRWLREEEADLAAVKAALRACGEAIFLCHGTTAGPGKGYGICIAAGGVRPPAILSVREVPGHVRFILNWEDIELSPEVFVSIACSSGVTELARGGVRFGLEQGLFTSGTRRIVSPLWNVHQESALTWTRAFYKARQSMPDSPLEEAHRQACRETQQRYPHYYFWGAFVMNGAL